MSELRMLREMAEQFQEFVKEQERRNALQDKFNVSVKHNIGVLGRKVLPDSNIVDGNGNKIIVP